MSSLDWLGLGSQKGVLLTLMTIVLLILMLGILITYVTLNIGYSNEASQGFGILGSSTFASTIGSSLKPVLLTSLQRALSIYVANSVLVEPLNYTAANALKTLVGNAILNDASNTLMLSSSMGAYTNAIITQAGAQGFNVIISNQTIAVFQTSKQFLNITYTALAAINSSYGTFAYPISSSAGLPIPWR